MRREKTPETHLSGFAGEPEGQRRTGFFWLGAALITGGVLLHLPMYFRAREMHYHMAGMGVDRGMVIGMALMAAGLVTAGYSLLPRHADFAVTARLRVRAIDDAPITKAHVVLLVVLAFAVTVDVMKPASLAFVAPGAAVEYDLKSPLNPDGGLPVALLPLSGITGTAIGALLWGWLGDRLGRRSAVLLAGLLFVATSACGAMPSFELNLLMCLFMGMSAGGLLPVAFTLLAETIPARHRGWLMVLIGGDIAGAYILVSWASETLTPTYGWRVLWLLGLPTGVLLLALTRWVPESPRYLLAVGRDEEARKVLRRYNAEIVAVDRSELEVEDGVRSSYRQLLRGPFLPLTGLLALTGLGIGLVVNGFQLWLPTNLRRLGLDDGSGDRILRDAALAGFPLNFLVAYLYHRSARWTLTGLCVAVAGALAGFVALGDDIVEHKMLLTLLLVVPIWGASSIVAALSAYSAEVYPTRIRSRGSGLTAGMTKIGGVFLIASVVLAPAEPSMRVTAAIGGIPIALAAVLAYRVAIETRHRRLEDITSTELRVPAATK